MQAHVKLICNQGCVVSEVKANPGLKVNRGIIFSFTNLFDCFLYNFLRLFKLKTEDRLNNIQKTPLHLTAKLQSSNQNVCLSWVNKAPMK